MSTTINRYVKGFRPRLSEKTRARLKAWEKTCLPCRVAEAIGYLLSIVAVAAGSLWLVQHVPWWVAAPAYLCSVALIARQQRVLELFVHDASHYCWDKSSRRRNDLVANLLAAWPSFSTVEGYRRFHVQHHAYYGSGEDPCRLRMMANLGLLAYAADWYRQIGSKGVGLPARWAAWHASVLILPGELLLGTGMGVAAWLAWWLVPAAAALPALRWVAEAEEHDYAAGSSELATTYTNLGWLRLAFFHPAGDAYHLVHHLWPGIPMRHHRKVHRMALEAIPEYRQGLIRG
jgi:fatty acid desaturase